MNDETPPVLNSDAGVGSGARKPSSLGRIGLHLSLVAPAVFLLFVVLRPG